MPQRTCVACRTSAGKRGFVRIVRTPEGRVEVDSTGKRPGRGAYVCASRECWEEALKRDRLGRALRTTISATDRDALMRYAEGLAKAPAAV
jgi:hypothetical protein